MPLVGDSNLYPKGPTLFVGFNLVGPLVVL